MRNKHGRGATAKYLRFSFVNVWARRDQRRRRKLFDYIRRIVKNGKRKTVESRRVKEKMRWKKKIRKGSKQAGTACNAKCYELPRLPTWEIEKCSRESAPGKKKLCKRLGERGGNGRWRAPETEAWRPSLRFLERSISDTRLERGFRC